MVTTAPDLPEAYTDFSDVFSEKESEIPWRKKTDYLGPALTSVLSIVSL